MEDENGMLEKTEMIINKKDAGTKLPAELTAATTKLPVVRDAMGTREPDEVIIKENENKIIEKTEMMIIIKRDADCSQTRNG